MTTSPKLSIPVEIIRDLFPVQGFDISEDNDYFQQLFTDERLIPEREQFLEAIDGIWELYLSGSGYR